MAMFPLACLRCSRSRRTAGEPVHTRFGVYGSYLTHLPTSKRLGFLGLDRRSPRKIHGDMELARACIAPHQARRAAPRRCRTTLARRMWANCIANSESLSIAAATAARPRPLNIPDVEHRPAPSTHFGCTDRPRRGERTTRVAPERNDRCVMGKRDLGRRAPRASQARGPQAKGGRSGGRGTPGTHLSKEQ